MPIVSDEGIFETEIERTASELGLPFPKPEEDVVRPIPYGLNPPEGSGNIVKGVGKFIEKTAKNITTIPQRAIENSQYSLDSGNYDPTVPVEAAATAVLGSFPLAKTVGVDMTLGSFAGTGSKTLDKSVLEVAQAADRDGISPREIADKTGFFKGADGRWRYEIDDSAAKFNPNWADNPSSTQKQAGFKKVKLPEVIDHPDLYTAYPQLKKYDVIYDNNFKGIAEFSGETIRMGKAAFNEDTPAYLDKSILMHEVQHAIQDIEGFAKGGAPLKAIRGEYKLKYDEDINKLRPTMIDLSVKEMNGQILSPSEQAKLDYLKVVFNKYGEYLKAGDKKAYENYLALAGEVEARNTQTRVNLTPAERMKTNPLDTEDIPRSEQLARHSPTATTPYKAEDGYVSYVEPTPFRRGANDNIDNNKEIKDMLKDPVVKDVMDRTTKANKLMDQIDEIHAKVRKEGRKLSEIEREKMQRLLNEWNTLTRL